MICNFESVELVMNNHTIYVYHARVFYFLYYN